MDMDGLGYSGDFASVGNFGGPNFVEMNRGVTPIFSLETVPDPIHTEEGGCPRFTSIEVVRLFIAGDTLNNGVPQPVTEEIRIRFAEAYARFKAGNHKKFDGMPLAEWPAMTPILIKEFEALHVFSVEGLAEVSDANINRHQDGRAWREKAKAFLAHAKDSSVVQKFAAENERLRDDIARMQSEVERMRGDIITLKELSSAQQREKMQLGKRA